MIQYIPILLKQQNYSFSFTIPNQIVTKIPGIIIPGIRFKSKVR